MPKNRDYFDKKEGNKDNFLFKVVILGDGGIGKTTLINRYITGSFKESYKMTIGVDFRSKTLNIKNLDVYLQLWDFAGEDRFRFLIPGYVEGANGGIFMYDITRLSSLLNLKEWYLILEKVYKGRNLFPIILVGSKADLEKNRSIDYEQAHEFCESHKMFKHIECSSKTGKNVGDIFDFLAHEMVSRNFEDNK